LTLPHLPDHTTLLSTILPSSQAIPREVLRRAKGLAIFTVIKAGFVWSARVGSGVVIARLTDGSWSAPSCIGTGGVGFGLQIGADLSEFVIVLNSEEAVKAFSQWVLPLSRSIQVSFVQATEQTRDSTEAAI
jgi:lipid-binding SYLF domain-containing protein